jgi:N-acetylmuramoyl-L-alanine amidase
MSTFAPDAAINVSVVSSPNQNERVGALKPSIILLHYTGMQSARAALDRLCSPQSQVSTHYFVFEDGRIVQCVPEARRAWHAGSSLWRGADDVNSRSIGIELVNPGHDHGYADFPPPQIAAVISLCTDIIRRNGILPQDVLAHSDVAPARKEDPGEKFPWATLHASGVGHWVAPAPASMTGLRLGPGDAGSEVEALQRGLCGYGYGLDVSGCYEESTATVVRAFQRHFRPERVDGIADASTLDTLARLSAALAKSANSHKAPCPL